jgi:dihydroxy-acid dehydratase
MGIASANIPSIQLVTGPMLAMPFEGEQLGACTDCRRFWGKYRAGEISDARINDIEGKLATTAGTCAVMGTASTMACITEVLGMSLPGGAAIPAVHADRLRLAEACGERAMEMAVSGSPLPQQIITSKAIENALTVLLAISGSTNAVVHLAAIAGRCGIDLPLGTINRISDETPVLVNLKPTGDHYMQDLFAAGGLTAVLHELKHQLHLDCLTVTGETLGHWLSEPPKWVDRNVIRKFNEPYQQEGGLIALFGTLAPTGAIIKRGAADSRLFERTGRAVVFESLEDLSSRIDSEELDVTEDDFLVLKNAGPKSASCMPEAGYLPIPKKLAARGVKDMVRISDARMSGTAFGTVVLHVSPDASSGGSLAFVRTGDQIRLSVKEKKLDLLVSEEELALRQRNWKAPDIPSRGYARLYYETVTQAPLGCDFNFLRYNQKR